MRLKAVSILCVLSLLRPADAQTAPTGTQSSDVVVTARLTPHCVRLPNDPLDDVTAKARKGRWVWIEPNASGSGYRYAYSLPNDTNGAYHTELGQWRRAGNALPTYIFRQPTDGTPSCIGKRRPPPLPDAKDDDDKDVIVVTAKVKAQMSGGQLQQLLKSGPYLCRSVRLTVNIATRGAVGLLWLNGGFGEAQTHDLRGNTGWTTIILEDGPVAWWYPWTGFGVEVSRGDVWIDQTKFEIIPDATLNDSQREAERRCQSHDLSRARS